jgi:hypothetical protein
MLINLKATLSGVHDRADDFRVLAIKTQNRAEREAFERIVEFHLKISEEIEQTVRDDEADRGAIRAGPDRVVNEPARAKKRGPGLLLDGARRPNAPWVKSGIQASAGNASEFLERRGPADWMREATRPRRPPPPVKR